MKRQTSPEGTAENNASQAVRPFSSFLRRSPIDVAWAESPEDYSPGQSRDSGSRPGSNDQKYISLCRGDTALSHRANAGPSSLSRHLVVHVPEIFVSFSQVFGHETIRIRRKLFDDSKPGCDQRQIIRCQ